MSTAIWYWLRLSRSGGPFGEAKGDAVQADLNRAGLQQFEDLMEGAKTTGPAAPPPLFCTRPARQVGQSSRLPYPSLRS